VHTILTMQH